MTPRNLSALRSTIPEAGDCVTGVLSLAATGEGYALARGATSLAKEAAETALAGGRLNAMKAWALRGGVKLARGGYWATSGVSISTSGLGSLPCNVIQTRGC
jgi:hypothetical protein